MKDIRSNIEQDTYPKFVTDFMYRYYKERHVPIEIDSKNDKSKEIDANGYPIWISNVMEHLNIVLR
jgi:hypothetical protein